LAHVSFSYFQWALVQVAVRVAALGAAVVPVAALLARPLAQALSSNFFIAFFSKTSVAQFHISFMFFSFLDLFSYRARTCNPVKTGSTFLKIYST